MGFRISQVRTLYTNHLRFLISVFSPSREHGAFSATLLFMMAMCISRVIGYVREAYIAYAFGVGSQTDAYIAAFTVPDMLFYVLAGGSVSITFTSLFTRYLSEGREEEAQKAFSVIVTVMTVVLVVGITATAVFAPKLEHYLFPKFTPEQLKLCVYLTRVLLPAKIFFYVGGIFSAVLISGRRFLLPAFGPLLYSVFIIMAGVLLGRRLGIVSLAIGALVGSLMGPCLTSGIGAIRVGIRYRPSLDISNPAFLEWVRMSIPLMCGVSLATADNWFLRHFASGNAGDITRLYYAKQLFSAPVALLGQAAGQATLPFFARLFGEQRMEQFERQVNNSVYRVSAVSLFVAAWLIGAALPLVDLVYRRGRFQFSDSRETAVYLGWFAVGLLFWSARILYARAFYAAGDTLVPMLAGTVITAASYPMYAYLFHVWSVKGLAIATGLGSMVNCLALVVLLDRRKFVRIAALPWREIFKTAAVATFAGMVSYAASRTIIIDGSRKADLLLLGVVSVSWAIAVIAGLQILNSELLSFLGNRKQRIYSDQPHGWRPRIEPVRPE